MLLQFPLIPVKDKEEFSFFMKGRTRFFMRVQCGRAKDNGHKLSRRYKLNTTYSFYGKKLFTMKTIKVFKGWDSSFPKRLQFLTLEFSRCR